MKQPPLLSRTALARQRGAALLIFMLIFFLASASWLLSRADSLASRARADQTTSAALAQAREALIGRAAIDNNRPGSLPCPDTGDDGTADGDFGNCPASVGRLPWKTLDLPDLRDGEGNHPWYALASELRDNSTAPPINPTLALDLSLDGAANIAAIVFSAGPPLAGQNGRPSNDIDDYLDSANATGGPYASGPTSSSFNDRTVVISRDQLFKVVNRAILGLLSIGLEKYYTANANLYPEDGVNIRTALDPHLDAATKATLDTNGWDAITSYTATPDRQSVTLSVTVSPATTCTITPAQKPLCTNP